MKSTFLDLYDDIDEKTKVCGMCNQKLPLTMFGKGSGGNYLRHECKPCANKQSTLLKEIKKCAPEIPKDYKCPMCEEDENKIKNTRSNKKGVWCADHDHKSGKFRGWVCHKCNLGLGNFNDDQEILHRAIKYLNKFSE